MFKLLQVKMKVFVKAVEECMKMKMRQQWLHVVVLQKAKTLLLEVDVRTEMTSRLRIS